MSVNASYDKALSLAIPAWLNDYRDNVTNTAPTLKAMKALGGFSSESGSSALLCPLRHTGANVEVVGATPADASTYAISTESDQVTDASYSWAQLWAGIGISKRELNKLANNPAQMAKYVNSHTNNAIADFGKKLNTILHSTGYVYGSETAIANLQGSIYTAGTFGGIDSSGNAFWRSTVTDAASGVVSLAMIDSLLTTIQSIDGEQPNLMVTTPAIYSKIRTLLGANQRAMTSVGAVDKMSFGSTAIEYNGALIVADASCISESIYAINTNTLKLVVSSDAIEVEEVIDMTPMRKWRLLWNAQLTCSDRKSNGRLHTVKTA